MKPLLLIGLLQLALAGRCFAGDLHSVHHENVLGTSFDLIVHTQAVAAGPVAEAVALAEIDRLSAVVSTYDANSEVSLWLASKKPKALSPELTALLRRCDHWRQLSHGAFHPGVEAFTRAWKAGEQRGEAPSGIELDRLVESLRPGAWNWTAEGPQATGLPITVNALAKGTILDAVASAVLRVKGVTGVAVVIGGDLVVQGDLTRPAVIASPQSAVTGVSDLDVVRVHRQGLATSSGKYRGVTIDGVKYSHLIDPRSGLPVDHVLSASVIAPTAEDADALATICSVLPVSDSLELIASLDDTECLIVDRAGHRHRSAGWNAGVVPPNLQLTLFEAPKADPWNGGYELEFSIEINQAGGGGRYRRPYVAAWVEDSDGYPVKTLVLWVQSTGPGPRWIPDLKRWYRSDRLRQLADPTDLVTTISEATRKPGQYSVTWDGRDDGGKLVKPGEYTVYVEAAREHGTYQISKKKVAFGDKPFKETFEGNQEIKAASIEYRKPKPAAAR